MPDRAYVLIRSYTSEEAARRFADELTRASASPARTYEVRRIDQAWAVIRPFRLTDGASHPIRYLPTEETS